MGYYMIIWLKHFGFDTAKKYLESNEEAIKTIESIVKSENIDCDFCFQDSYVYTCSKDHTQMIKDEVKAVASLGLNAEFVTKTPLPFPIEAAIKFPNQARFHPRKYLLSLLPILEKRNVKLY